MDDSNSATGQVRAQAQTQSNPDLGLTPAAAYVETGTAQVPRLQDHLRLVRLPGRTKTHARAGFLFFPSGRLARKHSTSASREPAPRSRAARACCRSQLPYHQQPALLAGSPTVAHRNVRSGVAAAVGRSLLLLAGGAPLASSRCRRAGAIAFALFLAAVQAAMAGAHAYYQMPLLAAHLRPLRRADGQGRERSSRWRAPARARGPRLRRRFFHRRGAREFDRGRLIQYHGRPEPARVPRRRAPRPPRLREHRSGPVSTPTTSLSGSGRPRIPVDAAPAAPAANVPCRPWSLLAPRQRAYRPDSRGALLYALWHAFGMLGGRRAFHDTRPSDGACKFAACGLGSGPDGGNSSR